MNKPDFNKLAKDIHQYNVSVGWWEGEQDNVDTKLMLAITEVAEAVEGERKGLMDDHLPHRKMPEVELADCLIRILDFGGRYDLRYLDNKDFRCYPKDFSNRYSNIYEGYFHLCGHISYFGGKVKEGWDYSSQQYTDVIDKICQIAETGNYDVISAMYEKIEYNKVRSDHKLENRMKDGGKKV